MRLYSQTLTRLPDESEECDPNPMALRSEVGEKEEVKLKPILGIVFIFHTFSKEVTTECYHDLL